MQSHIVIDPDGAVNHWFDGTSLKVLPNNSGRANLLIALGYTRVEVDATTWAELTEMFPVIAADA